MVRELNQLRDSGKKFVAEAKSHHAKLRRVCAKLQDLAKTSRMDEHVLGVATKFSDDIRSRSAKAQNDIRAAAQQLQSAILESATTHLTATIRDGLAAALGTQALEN